MPWAKLCWADRTALSEKEQWATAGGVERMLRIYFLQQWFNLSISAMEEALYDSAMMRGFVGPASRCRMKPQFGTFRHAGGVSARRADAGR